MKLKVAIAGVGNCASVFVQGLKYYSTGQTAGLWHPLVAGLKPGDIEVVAAFDIDKRKVGIDVSEAMFSKPNVAKKYVDVGPLGVQVSPGITKGDVAPHLARSKLLTSGRRQVSRVIGEAGADVTVNLVSSGSDAASEEYARAALGAGSSFINCTPALLLQRQKLVSAFSRAGIALVGDDLMSQFGGTVFHRGLLRFMANRGVKITKSYQLDVGGGTETFNTIDETIRAAKRTVKTASVAREIPYQFETVTGTTDFVDYMGNDRTSYFWTEGRGFLNSGVTVDVYLRSSDGVNAGNILLDVIRATYRVAKNRKPRYVNEICAYGFKSPPEPMHLEEAYERFTTAFMR
jgi:myo-inositol-1-phosphate synthase